jgi:hypothetical protein
MQIEMSKVLVDEHIDRLRHAAQAPSSPLARRVWAIVMRRTQPAETGAIPRTPATQDVDRLAA